MAQYQKSKRQHPDPQNWQKRQDAAEDEKNSERDSGNTGFWQ